MEKEQFPVTGRFVVLDSLRGICACFIVAYHFNNIVFNHLGSFSLVTNASVFVDFFFVLSGFVITRNYESKILKGVSFKDYILLRFWRIYPLHFLVLIAFLAFQFFMAVITKKTFSFSEGYSFESYIASLLLIQSIGFAELSSWNPPSWSISAEFYTYIIYAISLLILRKKIWIFAAIILITTPFVFLILGKQNINITYDYGILRCLYGFFSGMLSYKMYVWLQEKKISVVKYATYFEIIVTFLIIVFIIYLGKSIASLWVPFLFSASVVLFAFEGGFISKLLKLRPFVTMGLLSYSIYMTHTLVQSVIYNAAKFLQKHSGFNFFNELTIKGTDQFLLADKLWQGDIWQFVGMVAVLIASFATYYLVENPANRWIRRYIQKKRHKNIPQAESSAF